MQILNAYAQKEHFQTFCKNGKLIVMPIAMYHSPFPIEFPKNIKFEAP
jgi:hypothetical protein